MNITDKQYNKIRVLAEKFVNKYKVYSGRLPCDCAGELIKIGSLIETTLNQTQSSKEEQQTEYREQFEKIYLESGERYEIKGTVYNDIGSGRFYVCFAKYLETKLKTERAETLAIIERICNKCEYKGVGGLKCFWHDKCTLQELIEALNKEFKGE